MTRFIKGLFMTGFKSIKITRGTQESRDQLAGMQTRFTSENARDMALRSVESRALAKARREKLLVSAKDFLKLKDELPKLQATDIIHMAMVEALADKKFEDAARYANMLAEYQTPKLARVETTNVHVVQDASDEELRILAGLPPF